MNKLKGKSIAIIATDGFEKSELKDPKQALVESGASTKVLTPNGKPIKAWSKGEWSDKLQADGQLEDARVEDFDGLLIPGGTLNADQLRDNVKAVTFVKDFFAQQKPVAAICHGPQLLINADVVKNRKLTSYSSVSQDLKNAGANWVDEEVVVDQGLTTSRTPDDLPAFINKMIEEFSEGKHAGQTM
jgi:protease I